MILNQSFEINPHCGFFIFNLFKMLISKEVFDKEVGMCKELYKNQWWCNWWKCESCGVLLLLHKFYFWEVIENKESVSELKDKYLI